jgi:hypothetical protein
MKYEAYQAQADAERAKALAATTSPYMIEVRFLGGLNDNQQAAFSAAAERWTGMIVGDLPAVIVDGEVVDDVLILALGADIDGPGRILGQAGATHLRPMSAGAAAGLPAKGIMKFDTADLAKMESEGTLGDVITHEMGHVLGVSASVWRSKGLLQSEDSDDPIFVGPGAVEEYHVLRGADGRPGVPVENTGGPGTRLSHWRESVFHNELMSGFVAASGNPLSRVTVASLGDLGYQVDRDAGEPYALPDLLALAEEGALVAHEAPVDVGLMMPTIPQTLPDDSLEGAVV